MPSPSGCGRAWCTSTTPAGGRPTRTISTSSPTVVGSASNRPDSPTPTEVWVSSRPQTTGFGVLKTHLPRLAEQPRVAGLDQVVDDREPLVEPDERGLHRVDGEPPQIRPVVAERLDQSGHFAGHRAVAHQPVVGIDGHPEA